MQDNYFIFDDIPSFNFGLYTVRIGSNETVRSLWGNSSINEKNHRSRLTSFYYDTDLDNLEFSVTVALFDNVDKVGKPKQIDLKEWSSKDTFNIGKWLIQDRYKKLQFGADPSKIYYAKVVSGGELTTLNNKGYLEIVFRTNSPYAWTNELVEEHIVLGKKQILIDNKSNVVDKFFPKFEAIMTETGSLKITNISNGNKTTEIKNLAKGEIVSVDNLNKVMKSSRFGKYPFKDFNRTWLELVFGENLLELEGNFEIRFKSQFPIV